MSSACSFWTRAFDAALGGLVRIPDLEPLALGGFDFCLVAQDDHDVDRIQHFVGNGFGVLAGDVDAKFCQGIHGLGVQ